MQPETERDAEPRGDEQPETAEHPLEGGQTDAVDEAQEIADDAATPRAEGAEANAA